MAMKKRSGILLFLIFMILAACGDAPYSPSGPPSPSAVLPSEPVLQESAVIDTENPLLLADFASRPVYSGSGNRIGSYGYITIDKSELPNFFSKEFSDYFTEFANTRVRDSGYNWVSIKFDDGTGFCFTGSNTMIADYGLVDHEGCILMHEGVCMISSDEKFYFSSDLAQSIMYPSLGQEVLVPNNSFEPAPEIIFELPALENGLEDTPLFIKGSVVSRSDLSGYDTLRLRTQYGELLVSDVFVPMPQEISQGSAITVYFIYTGMSTEFGLPCGVYIHHSYL